MVAPDQKAEKTDGAERERHYPVSEYGLARKVREHVRHHAHARQNRDVNLRMTEKPEEMLPQ